LNAIVPRENFKLTKGNLKAYTYAGDSGKSVVSKIKTKGTTGREKYNAENICRTATTAPTALPIPTTTRKQWAPIPLL